MIPTPAPGALIRGSEQGFRLETSEEPDQRSRLALIGNGKDLLDSVRLRGLLEGNIAEKGANGGKTEVAGARRIVAVSLTVIEKGADQRCIDVFPGQFSRSSVRLSLDKLEQQTKSITIAGDGMRAGIPLA